MSRVVKVNHPGRQESCLPERDIGPVSAKEARASSSKLVLCLARCRA